MKKRKQGGKAMEKEQGIEHSKLKYLRGNRKYRGEKYKKMRPDKGKKNMVKW